MEFFFPDSQDQVSPYFNFISEEHPVHRIRQRDDLYAHETLRSSPYDGILISKAIVDGSARGAGKYSMAQQQRLYRMGAHKFFRAASAEQPLKIMGDCGAFAYANEPVPPYSPTEVIDFYEGIGLDLGTALDHIIFGYLTEAKRTAGISPEPAWVERRELTIQLATEFHRLAAEGKCAFQPVGVAHGWDPESYQRSVKGLQSIGYTKIAIGGLVPLRTRDIREVVAAVSDVRNSSTEFHLFGVTRTEHANEFASFGVTSFDSTSPFRQAFMDDRDNYHTSERTYIALRVPQVDGNTGMKRLIRSGQLDQRTALTLEKQCLDSLRAFDCGDVGIDEALGSLRAYEKLHDRKGRDRSDLYRETLEASPWKRCKCGICHEVGIEVALFRGSERNKRRGFHNLAVFRERLDSTIPRVRSTHPR